MEVVGKAIVVGDPSIFQLIGGDYGVVTVVESVFALGNEPIKKREEC